MKIFKYRTKTCSISGTSSIWKYLDIIEYTGSPKDSIDTLRNAQLKKDIREFVKLGQFWEIEDSQKVVGGPFQDG